MLRTIDFITKIASYATLGMIPLGIILLIVVIIMYLLKKYDKDELTRNIFGILLYEFFVTLICLICSPQITPSIISIAKMQTALCYWLLFIMFCLALYFAWIILHNRSNRSDMD